MGSDDAVGLLLPRPSIEVHVTRRPCDVVGSERPWHVGLAPAENDRTERDHQGNRFLHLRGGGTVALRPHDAAMAAPQSRATMSRPVSLGEVLGWSAAQKRGLSLPRASHCAGIQPPTSEPDGCCMLSAAQAERFVLQHGDNYGHVEVLRPDGAWESVALAADYMPAGAGRRYLREVGKRYGEFQRRLGGTWISERVHGTQVRLYVIDGQFEMLTDEQYVLRHGGQADAS